jgi:hypothetical protein
LAFLQPNIWRVDVNCHSTISSVFQAFLGFDGPMKSPCILRQSFSNFFAKALTTMKQPANPDDTLNLQLITSTGVQSVLDRLKAVLSYYTSFHYRRIYDIPMQRQWLWFLLEKKKRHAR